MPAAQPLLFPDPKPLVERLGPDFFKALPETPGVYLMRDAAGNILYIGKAKNLRKRLGSYRVANPDRMPRRHLRLVRLVAQIELQPCEDEGAALARESALLREVRPRFNRAGTWRPAPRYLTWRWAGEELFFGVAENPSDGWRRHGPLGSMANALRAVLTRLCWLSLHPETGFASLPWGWFHGRLEGEISLPCGSSIEHIAQCLQQLFGGQAAAFTQWVRAALTEERGAFEKACLEADLGLLEELFGGAPVALQSAEPPTASERRGH
ncbi:MAG: nucleotide excision repair endonuclease [Verrucomicrobiota bacterium]